MTPIQRNYKRLQENNTPANVAKYLEYISTKTVEEILADFNCLYTVPSVTTYRMINVIVKDLYDVKDVSSLIYCKNELESFKMDCDTKGINLFTEELTEVIKNVNDYIKRLSNSRTISDAVVDSVDLNKGCHMESLLKEYTSNLVSIITNEASDEADILDALDAMCKSELKIELEKKARYDAPKVDVVSNPNVLRKIGSSSVILGFNIYEFNKLIANQDTETNTMLNAVKEAYNGILQSNSFSFDDYNRLIEAVENVEDKVAETEDIDSEIRLKVNEYLGNLNEVYKKLMEAAEYDDIDVTEVEEVDSVELINVVQHASPDNIAKDADVEELPDEDIIEELHEYAIDYEELKEVSNDEKIDSGKALEVLENMTSRLYNIETILEDSGRNTMSAKVARKREQLSRKAVVVAKKAVDKNRHAMVATKKAAQHIDNLVSSTIEKIINSPYKDKREEIIKGQYHIKLHNLVKKAILHGGAFYINPVLGAIALMGTISRDKYIDARVRKQVIDELQEELKMIDEKIDDAKSDGNKQQKYQLMRMRSKVEKEIERISQHRDKIDNANDANNDNK